MTALSVDEALALSRPHLARLTHAFGIGIDVSCDLAEHLRIAAVDAGLEHGRPPMVANPAFLPVHHPQAGWHDTLMIAGQHSGMDAIAIGARILPVGRSLPADIESGALFYGRRTEACGFRWESELHFPEIADTQVVVAGGMWRHPALPKPGNADIVAPLWRLLLSSLLNRQWRWVLGVQKRWNVERHGLHPQGFRSNNYVLRWRDEPELLSLSIMSRREAEAVARTLDYGAA